MHVLWSIMNPMINGWISALCNIRIRGGDVVQYTESSHWRPACIPTGKERDSHHNTTTTTITLRQCEYPTQQRVADDLVDNWPAPTWNFLYICSSSFSATVPFLGNVVFLFSINVYHMLEFNESYCFIQSRIWYLIETLRLEITDSVHSNSCWCHEKRP